MNKALTRLALTVGFTTWDLGTTTTGMDWNFLHWALPFALILAAIFVEASEKAEP